MSGAGGPSGVDAETFKHWRLQFGVYSEKLRDEMAKWVTLLSNVSPIHVIYCVANLACMLAVYKEPGV